MEKKVLIFDFDGVIADSFLEMIKTFNSLADSYRFKKFSLQDAEKMKDMTSKQFYMEAFGISPFKLMRVVKAAKLKLKEKITSIRPAAGIAETLAALKKQGHVLGIITSNSLENVEKFLDSNNLRVFDFVISGNVLFKHRNIVKCIRQHRYNREDVYYVGDETRDIEAARKSRVKFVGVTWGFGSRRLLQKYWPDFLIDSPEELLSIIS